VCGHWRELAGLSTPMTVGIESIEQLVYSETISMIANFQSRSNVFKS
jgi:hypothetical protein